MDKNGCCGHVQRYSNLAGYTSLQRLLPHFTANDPSNSNPCSLQHVQSKRSSSSRGTCHANMTYEVFELVRASTTFALFSSTIHCTTTSLFSTFRFC